MCLFLHLLFFCSFLPLTSMFGHIPIPFPNLRPRRGTRSLPWPWISSSSFDLGNLLLHHLWGKCPKGQLGSLSNRQKNWPTVSAETPQTLWPELFRDFMDRIPGLGGAVIWHFDTFHFSRLAESCYCKDVLVAQRSNMIQCPKRFQHRFI